MTRARPYDRDVALNAAMQLFWRKGYHATSLKDLEAALKMKPGSIYAAFQSKEALYLASLERYYHSTCESLQTKIAEAGSPLAGLAEFLRGFGMVRENPNEFNVCMVVKSMIDATAEDAKIGVIAREYLDLMSDEFAAIFQQARDLGELDSDADISYLARRYQMNLTALRFEAQRGGTDATLAKLAEEMAHDVEKLRVA